MPSPPHRRAEGVQIVVASALVGIAAVTGAVAVDAVVERFLECGVLEAGFARLRCPDCGDEYLLAQVLQRYDGTCVGRARGARRKVEEAARPSVDGSRVREDPELPDGGLAIVEAGQGAPRGGDMGAQRWVTPECAECMLSGVG